MVGVPLIDNFDLEAYLADVSIGCSNQARGIQSKCQQDKFQDQVIYQENHHHFRSTGATEKLKSPQVDRVVQCTSQKERKRENNSEAYIGKQNNSNLFIG